MEAEKSDGRRRVRGQQVRDINRTVTYKPGTTAPKTVPDEGANVASLIDVLKAAE
ncbi:MAG: hypothetical protein MSC54_06085 [Clostridiales bacterium]|nr:hypothetical protein [Clostridiales bacterium]